MSRFDVLSSFRDTAIEVKDLATHPEILAVIAITQAGCEGEFSSTEFVTDPACAQKLESMDEDAEDISSSNRIGLSENGYVGYAKERESGLMCIVKSYTAWDPSTLENLSEYTVEELLAENLVGLSYQAGSSFSDAAEEENLGEVYLGDSVGDFDLTGHDDKGGNLFAAVCPKWEGPSELVVTDLCRYVVSVNGDSSDVYPDVPECYETNYPDIDACD